ncbi:hypothetical protein VUR80DRAFT_6342 [Thermomyces stellatus]
MMGLSLIWVGSCLVSSTSASQAAPERVRRYPTLPGVLLRTGNRYDGCRRCRREYGRRFTALLFGTGIELASRCMSRLTRREGRPVVLQTEPSSPIDWDTSRAVFCGSHPRRFPSLPDPYRTHNQGP